MVLLEKEYRFVGGSTASTIWIFNFLNTVLGPRDIYDLALWAIQNRGSNNYTPFGAMHGDEAFSRFGRTVAGRGTSNFLDEIFQLYDEERSANRKSSPPKSEADREKEREFRRSEHEARIAHFAERSLKIKSEIEDARCLPLADKIQWLVTSSVPMPAVPLSLFEAPGDDYRGIDEVVMAQFVKKAGAYSGAWQRLVRIIQG